MIDSRRRTLLNSQPVGSGAVVYWMIRDRRVRDNDALLYAAHLAQQNQVPLVVAVNIVQVGKIVIKPQCLTNILSTADIFHVLNQ